MENKILNAKKVMDNYVVNAKSVKLDELKETAKSLELAVSGSKAVVAERIALFLADFDVKVEDAKAKAEAVLAGEEEAAKPVVAMKANARIDATGKKVYLNDIETRIERFEMFYRDVKKASEKICAEMYKEMPIIREFCLGDLEDDRDMFGTLTDADIDASAVEDADYEVHMRNKIVGNSEFIRQFENDDYMYNTVDVNGTSFQIGTRYHYFHKIVAIRTPRNKKLMDKLSKGFSIIIREDGSYDVLPTDDAIKKYGIHVVMESQYFKAMTWAPAGEKSGVKFAIASKPLDNNGIMELFRKLDACLGGTFEEQYTNLSEISKVLKNVSRWGNYTCAMTMAYEIDLEKDCIAIVEGSIQGAPDLDVEQEAELGAAAVDFGRNIIDGTEFNNVENLAEALVNRYGYKMAYARRLAKAMAPQCRVDIINSKVMAEMVDNEHMTMQVKVYKAIYGDDNVKIYGNPNGRVALICDHDGAKMIKKTIASEKKLKVYFMAIAGASSSSTSNQMLLKCLEKDYDGTLEACNELLVKHLRETYLSARNGKAVYGSDSADNIASMCSQEEVKKDFFLMAKAAKKVSTVAKSVWSKYKIKIDTLYNHVMFDSVYSVSGGLIDRILTTRECKGIEMVEVFSFDVCVKYAKEIAAIENNADLSDAQKTEALDELMCAVIIKYPSAAANEYLPVRYLTIKEYYALIDAKIAGIDVEELDKLLVAMGELPVDVVICDEFRKEARNNFKAYLRNRYRKVPFGVTYYASYNWVKHKLAGMDSDYDGTVAIFEKAIRDILVAHSNNEITYIDYYDSNKLDYDSYYNNDEDDDDDEDVAW